jgi:hypothetical protein
MFPQFQVHYWRGIADALQEIGCEIWIARVPRYGTSKWNDFFHLNTIPRMLTSDPSLH